jgi:hypothetical protein
VVTRKANSAGTLVTVGNHIILLCTSLHFEHAQSLAKIGWSQALCLSYIQLADYPVSDVKLYMKHHQCRAQAAAICVVKILFQTMF